MSTSANTVEVQIDYVYVYGAHQYLPAEQNTE